MGDLLQRLYAAKAAALAEEEARESYADVAALAGSRMSKRRSLAKAVRCARGPAVVAEIKRASPSIGLISRNFDPVSIASRFRAAGVDAVSVVTEADHFLGDLRYVEVARAQTHLPVLRKDFLATRYAVAQAAAYGADAVLLIAAGLDDAALRELSDEAARFGLETLVEVRDEDELARALAVRADVVGINDRDSRTFETDLGVSEVLLPKVPPGTLVISESGAAGPADIARLHALGAHGFLIGEALMRADDPASFVDEVKSACLVRSSPR